MSPIRDSTHFRVDGPTGGSGSIRPPLVLVHGVGLDLHMWDLVVDTLAVERQVVRYDLLGHGRSADPPGQRSLDDLVAQGLEVMSHATAVDGGGRKPDLVGLSLGGLVAMAVGSRYPNTVGRLVAMNTVFERTPEQITGARARLFLAETEGMGPVADLAVDRWFSPEWQVAHPARMATVEERIRTNDVGAYLKAYRVFVDGDPMMPGAAAAITASTLVMTGELDPGSTPAMSRDIASLVPRGRSRILSGLRHVPPIEAPGECVDALLEFLDEPTSH